MKKQFGNLFNKKLIFAAIALAVIAAISFYTEREKRKPAVHSRYPDFGIALPANYLIHGIDVSRYQKKIFWEDVKQMNVNNKQIGFAFIKATEGSDRKDVMFERNKAAAKKAGLVTGAYHFFSPSQSGTKQGENFIATARLMPGDMPPVLDAEQANGETKAVIQQKIEDWLAVAEKRYNIKPIIYSNIDFYKNYLAGRFDDYPLWIAHYYTPEKPGIKRNWAFWQHNDKGTVNGISHYVDFNVFNGDSTAFQQLLLK